MELVLALDAGTSGVRSVAFDATRHGPRLLLPRAHPALPATRARSNTTPTRSLLSAVATLRDVARRARANGDVVVALGHHQSTRDNGRLRPRDGRTSPPRHRLAGPTHRRVLPTNSTRAARRPWCARRPDSYSTRTSRRPRCDGSSTTAPWTISRAPSFATVDSWLTWWLTGGVDGGVFATEPSNASRTMLMDLATCAMVRADDRTCSTSIARCSPRSSRRGRPSASSAATWSPNWPASPITGILGDQQAALFGQACFRPGRREGDLRHRRLHPRQRRRRRTPASSTD